MFSYDEYRQRIDNCFKNRRFTISMPEEERSTILKELQCPEETIELYQYRKCNDYSFDDYKNNQITLAHPKYFNDMFDVMPYINLDEFINTFNKLNLSAVKRYFNILQNRDFTEQEIQELGSNNTAVVIKNIFQQFQCNENLFYANFDTIRNYALLQTAPDLCQICLFKRNETRIACFSENYDSPIMWGHYADSSKGFCVGRRLPVKLSMAPCPSNCSKKKGEIDSCINYNCINNGNNWLFPIIYCSERPDFTKDIEEQFVQTQFQKIGLNLDWNNYNLFSHLKFACYKSSDWKYEREWRWIHTLCSNEIPDFSPISVGTISGLYLGEQISQEHEAILKEYASKHKLPDGSNIPIYKMTTDLCNPQYKLTAKRIL